VVDDGPRADEEVARERDRALIAAALERLSLDERAAFVLHDVDGCTAPEIAGALEVPLNTVYSRLRRARRKFETAVRALRRRGGRP
jgi:RNA polymerase sigma-70 factor, ECF subfamily